MIKQKKALAAFIAIGIFTSLVLPPKSILAGGSSLEAQKEVKEALIQRTFYNYNVAYEKIIRLPEGYEKNVLLSELSAMAKEVYTADILSVLKDMELMCSSKSGKIYDELKLKIEKGNFKKVDKEYLLGELTSWGTDLVWTADYKKAVSAIFKLWEVKTVEASVEAEKAISELKLEANKVYLLQLLNEAKAQLGIKDKVPGDNGSNSSGGTSIDDNSDSSNDGGNASGGGGTDTGSNPGNNPGDTIVDKLGEFGGADAEHIQEIKGNLYVKYAAAIGEELILKNLKVEGKLTVDFGEGNVYLDNVMTEEVNVVNVGENSLHIKGSSSIGILIISDNNGSHLKVEGNNAAIKNATILASSKIDVISDNNSNAPVFSNLTIKAKTNDKIVLSGNFNTVNIEAPTNFTLESGNINKVQIDTKDSNGQVKLSGNLNNVNILSNANIVVGSGRVDLSASENVQVKLEVKQEANVRIPESSNITANGSGTIEKRQLSDQAKYIGSMFSGISFYTRNGQAYLYGIPLGIKAKDFAKNIVVSPFAKVEILGEKGEVSLPEEYVTESKTLRITSENGKNKMDLVLTGGTFTSELDVNSYFYSDVYKNAMDFSLDENSENGKISASVKIKKAANESLIDGYLVSVKAVKSIGLTNYEHIVLHQIFVPKDITVTDYYTVNIKDADLKGCQILSLNLVVVANNKKNHRGQLISIYDNPVNQVRPSIDGISINEFTDLNAVKGTVAGKMSFTPGNDPLIKHYKIMVAAYYNGGSSVWNVSYIDASNVTNGKIECDIYNINVNNPLKIELQVQPLNESGLESEIPAAKQIIDLPNDEVFEIKAPKLYVDLTTGEDIITDNTIYPGYNLKAYKFNADTNKFEPISSDFMNMEPGMYIAKYISYDGSDESGFSNAVTIKPKKLTGIVYLDEARVDLLNADSNAEINLYNSNMNLINTTSSAISIQLPTTTATPGAIQIQSDTFFISQRVNGIESDKTLIKTSGNYSMDELIDYSISSTTSSSIAVNFNKTSKEIEISKKTGDKIGLLHFDNYALINMFLDVLDPKKVFGKYYNLNDIIVTSLDFNIEEDFDTLKAKYPNGLNLRVKLITDSSFQNYRIVFK